MASYDLKAILGEKLRRLTDKTLKALVDCMCTVGASLCSLDKRVSALESVELPEGGYKPMQEPVASPSASGTAVQFIESVSQDATGRMTATKKTVRTGSTSQTGVLQLEDSHTSTSTTKAATPNSVKEAYDLANTANTDAVKNVAYDSTNKKITKTINGQTTDVVSAATLKTDMALNNVDNTSDANKPVSTAQQAALDLKLDKTGDGKDVTATFTEASTRANIASGESNATIFGKIAKWLSDLKALAFKDKVGTGDVESGTYGISVSGNAGTASAAQSGSALETAINDKQDTCIYVKDSPDWNDLTETGFYEIKNSSTDGTKHSPESGKMHCIVTKVVDNSNRAYINQIALGDYIYKRYKFENDSWTTWKNIPYSAKFTSADSGKLVGIDANALLSTFNANVSDITNIANYNRVHVEAYRDNTGPNYPRYSKVGMYRYDSGTAVLVPQQTGSLGPGELVGAPEAILQQSNQNWNPTLFNCEDFLIVRSGYSVEVTDIFQLGNIVTSPSCRRFRIRFANLDSYDWLIRFCHTESNGTYSGSINIITNKLGRFDNFYEVKVRPKKCVLVDLIISTVGYNITEGIIVMIDTDEPDETT